VHLSFEQLILPIIALLAAIISGITGLGGGALLMAFMSTSVDPQALIPLHGLVQLGSNGSRVFLGFQKIEWRIVRKFFIGVVIGGGIGFLIPIRIESEWIALTVGLFLITTTWLPIEKLIENISGPYWILGALSTFISLFVGISGPLVHPILIREKNLNRHAFIATEAACSGLTHIAKIVVYLYWDFSFLKHSNILVIMILMTFLGAYLGGKLLNRVSEKTFRLVIKIFVTALASRMLLISAKL
jgi:uncharacterized membrane protein YfcA